MITPPYCTCANFNSDVQRWFIHLIRGMIFVVVAGNYEN